MFGSLCHICKSNARSILSLLKPSSQLSRRTYIGKDLKRFYKNVSISQSNGGYEINLDKRKLKTPLGQLFIVPHEALALAVAQEWEAQHDKILRNTMHITSLCNTAIDNPTRRSRDVVINAILEFLHTDTICYRLEEPPELVELQKQHWDPLLQWLEERYSVVMHPTTGIAPPVVPTETRELFYQHLSSYNSWALVGYQEIVECLKSMVLTAALVDRFVTVEEAVKLGRLELEFQIGRWGNVEWHHDVELMELRARVAAATLFFHLNTESSTVQTKRTITRPV